MPLRRRNTVILAKAESTPGTDSAPVVGSDALLVDEVTVTPKADILESNEYRGTLDAGIPTIGVMPIDINVKVPLKASGTQGTASEAKKLLLACGLAETSQAALGPFTAASGTTNSITGTTGANGTFPSTTAAGADLIGRPVALTVNPAAGATAIISNYVVSGGNITITFATTFGSTLSAATVCNVLQSLKYTPVSAAPSSSTIWVYIDGILWKATGWRAELEVSLEAGKKGMLSFTGQALFESKTDVGLPSNSSVVVDSSRPAPWKNGLMTIGGRAAAVQSLSVKLGNKTAFPTNPNAVEGLDPVEIVSRDIQGTVNPLETLIATQDTFADFRAETKRTISAIVGTVAGNRFGLLVPAAMYRSEEQVERDGFMAKNLPFSATGTDTSLYLSYF